MRRSLTKFCIILSCIFGFSKVCAVDIYPFFLHRQDGTVLEGYFSPPETNSAPIICAIQGSSCESALKWYRDLWIQTESLGVGLIVLEKRGISKDEINLFEYNQNNCLQNRLEDYVFCLKNMSAIYSGWKGQVIFWGESEGGLLAAKLAAQTPETAAVLLFATGGGLKPREEVKWAIRLRLERHGALQDEIDQYMSFLENQMDDMTLDPTPNNQFLGNTYKWWASVLAAEEPLMSLNQLSIPIYLAHGVEDTQIPILSSDLAAEVLRETNALTYRRLEGYGHDLNQANIQFAACLWLGSVLLGEKEPINNIIATMPQFSVPLSEDWRADITSYVFSRGNGTVNVNTEVKKDDKGNQSASGSVNVSKETKSGVTLKGEVAGSVQKDNKGNTKTEVKAQGSLEWEF